MKWFVPSRVDFNSVVKYAKSECIMKAESKSQALKFIDDIFDCRAMLNYLYESKSINEPIFTAFNFILTNMEIDIRNWLEDIISR